MKKSFVSKVTVAFSASAVFAALMSSPTTEEAVADLYVTAISREKLQPPGRDGTVPGCVECQREETNREGREEGSESYEEMMTEGSEENREIAEGVTTENEAEENADEGTENTEEEENRAEPEAIEDQREGETRVNPIEVEAESERVKEENAEESTGEEVDEDMETVETTLEVIEDARELREPVREIRETINEWDVFASANVEQIQEMAARNAAEGKVSPTDRDFPEWVNKVLIPVVDALAFETLE